MLEQAAPESAKPRTAQTLEAKATGTKRFRTASNGLNDTAPATVDNAGIGLAI